jgi:hypothetical protein
MERMSHALRGSFLPFDWLYHAPINMFTNESSFTRISLAKNAKGAKVFLGELGVFAYMDVGEGREQAVPAHPALTAFVHPCTADAEALREKMFFHALSV